jgi:hypothetical protein
MPKPPRSSPDRRGFNAVLGNPPWVLYAGKGSQPIDAREKAFLEAQYGRAAKPLSTHGLFATLAGRLGQPGSRVALVLPTSVADATRYSEVRASHDMLCQAESDLRELGEDAFSDVFQPCMALVSTCRSEPKTDASGDPWSLAQHDVESWVRDLLSHLDGLPKLPGAIFGERGFRSSVADRGKFAKMPGPKPPLDVPLYEGTSVREFELLPPTAFGDGVKLPNVLPAAKWQEVDLFIRQTAKYPIVSPSARVAFRNSIIAGFGKPPFTMHALLAYLNSSPVRWYHYHKQRDAQQGMPQVKVGHLRMLPAPQHAALERLNAIGAKLGRRGNGITPEERTELDLLAANALGISAPMFERLRAWAAANPPPEGRLPSRSGPGVKKAGVESLPSRRRASKAARRSDV